MREALRGTPELARKLADLEKKLTDRLDEQEVANRAGLARGDANSESAA